MNFSNNLESTFENWYKNGMQKAEIFAVHLKQTFWTNIFYVTLNTEEIWHSLDS